MIKRKTLKNRLKKRTFQKKVKRRFNNINKKKKRKKIKKLLNNPSWVKLSLTKMNNSTTTYQKLKTHEKLKIYKDSLVKMIQSLHFSIIWINNLVMFLIAVKRKRKVKRSRCFQLLYNFWKIRKILINRKNRVRTTAQNKEKLA